MGADDSPLLLRTGPVVPTGWSGRPQKGVPMCALLQIGLIFGGPLLVFITRNKRFWVLSFLGIAWFFFDVFVIAWNNVNAG